MSEAEGPVEVHGYRMCKCGTYVVSYEFVQWGYQCAKCFENGTFAPVREAALQHAGRLVKIRDDKHRKKRWPDKKNPAKHKHASAEARRARQRAMVQLANLHPEMFAVLLGLERKKAGLPMKFNGVDLQTPVETYLRERGYSPGSTGGSADDEHQPTEEAAPGSPG